MPLEYRFNCPLLQGLHARPASLLAEVAGRFTAEAHLLNERSGTQASLKSVLELVAAGVLHEDACLLSIEGPEDEAAFAALKACIEHLPVLDEPALAEPACRSAALPGQLTLEQVACYTGVAASPGCAFGTAVVIGRPAFPQALTLPGSGDPAAEQQVLRETLAAVLSRLDRQLQSCAAGPQAEIMRAGIALARDPALASKLAELIAAGYSAGTAVVEVINEYSTKLLNTGSAYLSERVVDVQDIGLQLLQQLRCAPIDAGTCLLKQPAVVFAANMSPRQLLELDRRHLRGLVLCRAGATAHAAILARSFGIPCVAAIPEASVVTAGSAVLLDGRRGLIITPVTPLVRCFYLREQEYAELRQQRLAGLTAMPATTRDGRALEVAANITSAEEAQAAVTNGADGVGLFRTEFLFNGSSAAPTEQQQFLVYSATAEAMSGRTVIIRTLDVGGDKPLPYVSQPIEENPFLGCRGLRLYKLYPELLRAQLRAICRASAHGPVWLMAPMVSTLEEAAWFREQVSAAQAELASAALAFDPRMPVGLMVEVPSLAPVLDQLCQVVDFFSIGTNDLSQYYFAADRGNPQVSALANVRHPAFLRLLRQIVESAREHGRWIGMCGEMAGDSANAALLVGLGLSEISLNAAGIPAMINAIGGLDAAACRQLLQNALACDSAASVGELLATNASPAGQVLLSADLIRLESASQTKAEVLHELALLAWAAGRTDDPDALLQALQDREAFFSTGLGFGFAIPHCKTDAVSASCLGLLKLSTVVDWDSADQEPVRVVLMLASRASDPGNQHLRLFAKLARRLMDEEFRASIAGLEQPAALLSYLSEQLGTDQAKE